MRHQDLTLNHRLESFVYANETERENAIGLLTTDAGRIAYQTDTGQYFRLKTATPLEWILIGSAGELNYAILQTTQVSPTGVTQPMTSRMMGLGAVVGNAAVITPNVTGKLRIAINGNISNSDAAVALQGCFCSGVFGSVFPAPANGAFVSGSPFGYQVRFVGARALGMTVPFSISAAAGGFAVGTPYWFDLQLASTVPSGTGNVTFVTMTIIELP